MKHDKNANISVRAVFIGRRSAEQVFTDLIRLQHKKNLNSMAGHESSVGSMSSNTNIYPDTRVMPNLGAML